MPANVARRDLIKALAVVALIIALLLAGAAGGWIWHNDSSEAEMLPTLAATAQARQVAAGQQVLAQTYTPPPTGPSATPTPRSSPTVARTPTAPSTSTPTTMPATPTPTQTVTPTALPPTEAPSATPIPRPNLRLTPGEPQPYLETYRLVAYYGSPPGAALGVLGAAPPEETARQLSKLAGQYQLLSPERYALPTFHIITTVADPLPGKDGDYSHWLDEGILAEWLDVAQAEELAVVLDIQPGYADLQREFTRLKPYLYRPHVHLALDSEFAMSAGTIPGHTLGHLHGEELNWIQAQLNQIALEIGLNKVLIVHQFDSSMLLDKEAIIDYPHVELVIDADGFGSPGAKRGDYLQYAAEPGFEYGGFKLFYGWDFPLMVPAEVMALEPHPAVIIYQ